VGLFGNINNMDVKKQRGQFFTTRNRVLDVLVSLVKNDGDIFEPSAGSGHIISALEKNNKDKIYSCELDESKVDKKVCESDINIDNFFNFIKNGKKYQTSIGNPPFVKLKNVEDDTINILPEKINDNGNLYYFFIKYSIEVLHDNGELIFIVPKEWLYNTSAQFLRDYLKDKGCFTHFIDCGEEKLFDDADVPSLCIFRFEVGFSGKVKYYESIDDYNINKFTNKNVIFGKTISFSNKKRNGYKVSDFFDVKVGLVSGKESVFKLKDDHNFGVDGVNKIMTTKKTYSDYLFLEDYNSFEAIPERIQNYLNIHYDELISRKIKKFTESDWWKYGAIRNLDLMKSNRPRIYGLMKTRDDSPFWLGDTNSLFSGGVFALFLKEGVNINIHDAVEYLNSDDFKEVMKESNLYSNNKVSITPSAFSSLPFVF
jgi:adenine-specific DNA-methyltransferase